MGNDGKLNLPLGRNPCRSGFLIDFDDLRRTYQLNGLNAIFLLAQVEAAKEVGKNDQFFMVLLPPLAIILVLFLLMDSPQRRERKKRDAIMKNLKKEDRVVTIGGIIALVANISQDGKEVTLKVEDGTRIRFRRSAISEVLSESAVDVTKPT